MARLGRLINDCKRVSYPGVYIEEVPSGVHAITGVGTSIAAFGMTDFNRIYGGLDNRSEASYAILQFFLNGGTEAYVIRMAAEMGAFETEAVRLINT